MTDPTSDLTNRVAAELFTDRPPHPPFDPEFAAFGPVMATSYPRAAYAGIEFTREQLPTMMPEGWENPDLTSGGAVDVTVLQVPGPQGDPDIALTILTPRQGDGPWPLIYNIHGGGMIMGDATTGIDLVLPYVADASAVVVSVEYRLAPEHPDPAPIEDCFAGLVWVAEHAEELRIDRDHMMVYGGSAGGGLAAGVALLARDRKGPILTHQILVSPMLDDRITTVSSHMLADDAPWDRLDNLWGWTALLGDRRGGSDVSPYAAPARAEDLSGLPRTYLDIGSSEGFRDEVLDYAWRLSEAGVVVDLHMWGGGFHGFDTIPSAIGAASKATRDEFIRRALGQ